MASWKDHMKVEESVTSSVRLGYENVKDNQK